MCVGPRLLVREMCNHVALFCQIAYHAQHPTLCHVLMHPAQCIAVSADTPVTVSAWLLVLVTCCSVPPLYTILW